MKRLFTTLSISFILSLGLVFAHSEFESSVPEDGAVLDTAPSEVIITFDKDIQPTFSVFKIYAIPADVLENAAMTSESGEHSEGEEHAEGESHGESETHSEGETQSTEEHSEEETISSESEHTEGEEHSETGEHTEGGEHGAMDAAAKLFIPTVIDLTGDEDARADAGLATTEELAKSITINLKEGLAPGAYVAMFRVLSADTHTVEGFITFEIKE